VTDLAFHEVDILGLEVAGFDKRIHAGHLVPANVQPDLLLCAFSEVFNRNQPFFVVAKCLVMHNDVRDVFIGRIDDNRNGLTARSVQTLDLCT